MTKVVRIGIILVIALGLSLPVSALDIGLGLDLDLNLSSGTVENPGTKTVVEPAVLSTTNPNARSTVGIGANVIIRTSDTLEITPFVKFLMQSSKAETTNTAAGTSTVTTTTRSNVFLTLGSAFYWHLVRGNTVELSLGPKVSATMGFAPERKTINAGTTTTTDETKYDKYLDLDFSVAADVVMDVKFTPSLMFRTTLTPAVLTLGFDNTKLTGSTNEFKATSFTLNTLFSNREASTGMPVFALPPMSFGLIYMF